ncbi:V-type ATP synthase subunit I, partial [Candidatus Aerophobetes bacterium]
FKPFEIVTELYGIPRYFEIDPTPFLAPFFAVFLALCLTDGGYGVILALLAYFIPKKVQVGESGKRLFSILFISGLLTIVVGTITGGMFGIQISQLPAFFAPLKRLTLFDPLKQPMVFLVISLALGVVHLLLGIVLAFWEDLRKGDINSAILDHLSWIVLILGVILFGLSKLGVLGKSFTTPGLIMSLSAAIILFLFAGRKSKSLFVRFGKGAFELYGLISLFGDVLSYSRLLALGLATSVIATVVNLIANMASGIPLIGPVCMVIILILGHLGNIAINTLSGFIHTARLQFVEFFGKFYEGGGKNFTPFKQEGKYTIMEK